MSRGRSWKFRINMKQINSDVLFEFRTVLILFHIKTEGGRALRARHSVVLLFCFILNLDSSGDIPYSVSLRNRKNPDVLENDDGSSNQRNNGVVISPFIQNIRKWTYNNSIISQELPSSFSFRTSGFSMKQEYSGVSSAARPGAGASAPVPFQYRTGLSGRML